MKKGKLIIVLLIISLLFGVVSAVIPGGFSTVLYLLFDSMDKEEERSPIFECQEMTIELTTDFKEDIYTGGYDAKFVSDTCDIKIDRVTITSEAPDGGFTIDHLDQFMSDYLRGFFDKDPGRLQFYRENGVLYHDADKDLDGDIDYLLAMYQYKNLFWVVIFRPIDSTFEESKAQFMEWSQNVTFPKE